MRAGFAFHTIILMRVMLHDGRLKHSKVETIASIMSLYFRSAVQIV